MTSQIFKLAIAAAAFAVSAPAFAKADESSFEKDGYTYVYKVNEIGRTTHIRGKYYPGGKAFALEVRNGRVVGLVNSTDVAFPLSAVKPSSSGGLASAD